MQTLAQRADGFATPAQREVARVQLRWFPQQQEIAIPQFLQRRQGELLRRVADEQPCAIRPDGRDDHLVDGSRAILERQDGGTDRKSVV